MGVDACRKGWVGFSSDSRGYFGTTIEDLVLAADVDGQVRVVAIDIPIGLPTAGTRRADVLARRLVGRRSSSVFATPVRRALMAPTHAEASAASIEVTGKGLSRQVYALRAKILTSMRGSGAPVAGSSRYIPSCASRQWRGTR